MKIALMMENSQAAKNPIILNELKAVADEKGFPVYNVGMSDENDHHLTYIHLGIMASILLNAKAVDFVVTGCGTGQGALMSLNIHPGVICGYYPPERKEPQVRNAGILNQVKAAVVKENYLDTLRAIDPELVKTAVSGQRFQQCFFENCQDKEIEAFVRGIVG